MPKQTKITKQANLKSWFSAKKRGRDDEQIEQDRKKAIQARSNSRKRTKPNTPKNSSSSSSSSKKQNKKKTPAPSRTRPRRKKYADSDDEEHDNDNDSLNDFVIDDDEMEEDDADDEEEFVHHSSSEDEELELTDSPRASSSSPSSRNKNKNNKTMKAAKSTAAKKTTRTKKSRRKYTDLSSEEEAEEEYEEESENDDFVLEDDDDDDDDDGIGNNGSADEDNDDSSNEGTFMGSYKQRPSKPTKALQRASIAAKTRYNPGLQKTSLAERFGKRGLQSIRTPALKKKPVIQHHHHHSANKPKTNDDKSNYDDLEDLTSPEMQQKRKSYTSSLISSTAPSLAASTKSKTASSQPTRSVGPGRSQYFRHSKVGATWDPNEAAHGSDDDDDEQPKSRQRQQSQQHAVTDLNGDSSDDGDDEVDFNARPPLSDRKAPTSADALLDSPEPASKTQSRRKQIKKQNPKRQAYVLSEDDDGDDGDDEVLEVMPRTKNNDQTDDRKLPSDEDHIITNEESADEEEKNDIKRAIQASKKDLKKKKKDTTKGGRRIDDNDDDDVILLDDDSMDEDEKVALRHALKESKKEVAKPKAKSSKPMQDIVDSEDEQPADGLLEDSSEDEEEDREDSYYEGKKEASSVLQTAEQLSAQVIKHMTGWTKEKDSSSSAHKGMIVDGALSLGFMEESESSKNIAGDNNNTSHEWISQDEMQRACPGVKLSNYQLIGVNWLALLHGMKCTIEGKRNTNVNGVLADEMGLGKTVQTIAFLAWLKYRRKATTTDIDSDDGASVIEEASWPHIIVVPVSVLPNWEREFETFCPEMNVVKYHGSLTERGEIQDRLREYLPQTRSKNPPLDVILAPITYFQKEKSDDRKFLNKFRFDYLVVDEAHMLKNSDSLRYKMLDRVSTRHRLLLTGTPVQNSPQELLNMLCFLMPLFSRGKGQSEEEENIGDRMLQHFVDEKKVEQSGDEQAAYRKLKQLFAPFVLRRKKIDVISQLLPPKERVVEFVKLDPDGRAVYDGILADHVNKNGNKLSAAIGEHLFTNLRKAAHHPLLLRTRHNSPTEVKHLTTHFHKYGAFKGEGSTLARVGEEVSKFNDFNIHLTALDLIEENPHRRADLERYILDEDALFSSAKFVRLKSLLPKLISEGHRILMFSVWTSCLDLLGCLMEHLGLSYLRMDGSCSSEERQNLIDEFNNNDSISVFLLSTKACGIGINLTAADTCIIHDLDFNPFNDLQAEDRCHRIGQKKPVTIYKLVTEDTVDSQIFEMQERKAKMNAAIMESNNNSNNNNGSDKNERKEMLQSAVNRFLESPKGKKPPPKASNKENSKKEVICLI